MHIDTAAEKQLLIAISPGMHIRDDHFQHQTPMHTCTHCMRLHVYNHTTTIYYTFVDASLKAVLWPINPNNQSNSQAANYQCNKNSSEVEISCNRSLLLSPSDVSIFSTF